MKTMRNNWIIICEHHLQTAHIFMGLYHFRNRVALRCRLFVRNHFILHRNALSFSPSNQFASWIIERHVEFVCIASSVIWLNGWCKSHLKCNQFDFLVMNPCYPTEFCGKCTPSGDSFVGALSLLPATCCFRNSITFIYEIHSFC